MKMKEELPVIEKENKAEQKLTNGDDTAKPGEEVTPEQVCRWSRGDWSLVQGLPPSASGG